MNNPYLTNALIPSPLGTVQARSTLNLTQIENFIPIKKFTDDTNIEWSLVKSSTDSTVDIPDPKSIQIIDYWNHEFPNLKTKIYVYVVEGIKQPRVETEKPAMILYQWFSTVFVPNFTVQMITDKEWLKANVYAAPIINSRVSKLKAICHIDTVIDSNQNNEDRLLQVEELNGRNIEGNTE